MKLILHACTLADWEAAQQQGSYTADSLQTEGFIHCSERETILRVANTIFKGRQDMYLLAIDEARLTSPVVYESTEAGNLTIFPHIYGPLNLDAVVGVAPFLPNESGIFDEVSIGV